MRHSNVMRSVVGASMLLCAGVGAQAQTVMQQCGQQYQAAKAGGTLNGMTWGQFRSDCAAKLKAQPASATAPATLPATPAAAPAAVPAVPATQTANPLNPTPKAPTTPTAASAAPSTSPAAAPAGRSAGQTAFVARERECGSEWRTNKATLVAQTPGLTWPKYLSQCNAKLKAAGK